MSYQSAILTAADIERNRRDPGAYRARSIAARLPAIIDYLEIADKTYRQDIDGEGDERVGRAMNPSVDDFEAAFEVIRRAALYAPEPGS